MASKLFSHLLILLLVVACASGHQRTSLQLRQFVVAGDISSAIKYLKESTLATDPNSKLLYFTELGLLEHYKGNFKNSNEALTQAKQLIEELYTTKVSGKISSFVSNDNADLYYSEKYEASLVYFYLSLNHFMMSVKETDVAKRKTHLESARAEVVAWDSFLTEIKNERLGKALFKEDLLAKTFGALVHESQGTHNDNQIALQLYKDAKDVFFKNYNLYPTFNAAYENFRSNFENFPKLPLKEIEGKYVLETEHSSAFKDFLNHKIQSLTARLKKGKSNSQTGSISFLVQDGIIAEKIPQKYEFPMLWGAHEAMAFSWGMGNTISFELPTVQGIEKLLPSRLEALTPEGVVVQSAPLSIISPLSELAQQAINEHSAAIAAKTAARVASKHVAALVAAIATYETGRRQNNSMTMLLASAGHAAAVASINHSERADVRFWSTLPSNIRMGHLNLPKGTYKFRAVFGQPNALEYRVVELGDHEITTEAEKFVMNKHTDRNINVEKIAVVDKVLLKEPNREISSAKK